MESMMESPEIQQDDGTLPVEIILPADLVEDRELDADKIRQQLQSQVSRVRQSFSDIVPMHPDEHILLQLIDKPHHYVARSGWDGPRRTIIKVNKPAGAIQLRVGDEKSAPEGWELDAEAGTILVGDDTLAAEVLHHIDRVYRLESNFPPELDPAWRGEMVDGCRYLMLSAEELANPDRAYEALEKHRWSLGRFIGRVYRQDIFPNPTLSPIAYPGHREAVMVVYTALELARRRGADLVARRFAEFSLQYRPPYQPLLDFAALAHLDKIDEVRKTTMDGLDGYQGGRGFHKANMVMRLDAAPDSELKEVIQYAGVSLEALREATRSIGDTGIENIAKKVVAAYPQPEHLTRLVEDLVELSVRLDYELKVNTFDREKDTDVLDPDLVAMRIAFRKLVFPLYQMKPSVPFFPNFDQGELGQEHDPDVGMELVQTHHQKVEGFFETLESHTEDDDQDLIERMKLLERSRHENRLAILELQETVRQQLLFSPMAVGGKVADKTYPTELARLRDLQELRHELVV